MIATTTSDTAPQSTPASLPVLLAFTAGYVDTVGFVGLFGLFTAHVTGNFVLIGSEIAKPTSGVLIKFLAFPAFIVAVIVARVVVLVAERAGVRCGPLLLGLQALLLLGFMVAGWLALPLHDASTPAALMAGMLGAAAMGIQNAAGKLIWNALTPTTVMTGNVTQLVIDLVDLVRGSSEAGTAARMRRFFWPVVAFGVGAIAGALGFVEFSFLALALPIVLIAGLAWQAALGRH
jgi:uncharacterized membrane protein YoaK (UPF0700 family)